MRRFALIAVAVLLGVGAGGGALAATGAPTSRHVRQLGGGEPSLLLSTRATSAAAFAEQVLAEAPVPSGSKPTSSVPPLLDQAMQRPGVPGLIDLDRIYSSPASLEEVEAD